MAKKAKKAKKTAKKTAKKKKKQSFDQTFSIRIASEVRCALRSTDRQQPWSQNIRATNSRPDLYADGCCITVRFFIGPNDLIE